MNPAPLLLPAPPRALPRVLRVLALLPPLPLQVQTRAGVAAGAFTTTAAAGAYAFTTTSSAGAGADTVAPAALAGAEQSAKAQGRGQQQYNKAYLFQGHPASLFLDAQDKYVRRVHGRYPYIDIHSQGFEKLPVELQIASYKRFAENARLELAFWRKVKALCKE